MKLIQIDNWLELPDEVMVRMYETTDVQVAQVRFEKQHGYKCNVAFLMRDKMLMVIDENYEAEP